MQSVLSMPIPLPSLSEQERIVGILDKFAESIDNLQEQIKERQKQYAYLIDNAFGGTLAEMKEKAVNAFLTEWDKYPALKKLRDFYETIPYAFTITQIGKVLAYTNAKRCDNSIPDMLLE